MFWHCGTQKTTVLSCYHIMMVQSFSSIGLVILRHNSINMQFKQTIFWKHRHLNENKEHCINNDMQFEQTIWWKHRHLNENKNVPSNTYYFSVLWEHFFLLEKVWIDCFYILLQSCSAVWFLQSRFIWFINGEPN